MTIEDRIRGTIYGQAIGDALGLGTEFLTKSAVRKYYPRGLADYDQIIRDGHRRKWKEGSWTDDTDQMLCIMESIIDRREVDTKDIALRLYRWVASGAADVGNTVHSVISQPGFLDDPHRASESVWEKSGRSAAANGGVMRTSVLGVWDYRYPSRVRENAAKVCRITHHDPRCVGSCVVVCLAISAILRGVTSIDELFEDAYDEGALHDPRIAEYLDRSKGSLDALDLDEGLDPEAGSNGSIGYTLKALGAAFWAMKHSLSFEGGISKVIHEGGDADSNGAVTGALLGALFGFSEIPGRLVSSLRGRARLEEKTVRLLKLVECRP
ncbi:MAG: ADP-ribosylglycohydrolase family protein [Candidatus Krumholzibacteria bacterium]|jgi:ADP-ribosylglycohydrolase|nr:ADP-ribosylglycohydrolase family protein [Candidatus Krumholzibacteria bacterium]